MQMAFDAAEEIEVNGKKVKSIKEWTPYNPALVAKDTREIDVVFPGTENGLEWYQTAVLGYSGLTVQKYLKKDIEFLEDALKNLFYSKDELLLLYWVYQCVRHKGNANTQQVWQMPEDFHKSFSHGEAETITPVEGFIPTHARLRLQPVQRPTALDLVDHPELGEKEWTEDYPVYFIKPLVYWLMKKIALSRGADVKGVCKLDNLTLDEVYAAYGEHQSEYWDHLESYTQVCHRKIEDMQGFIPDGRRYALELSMLSEDILFRR